ncbi:MAG TPA: hypothetical protein VE439_08480 [Anaerolineae bacterium]|nr:hypothetical protein [Anaerolineae bacterium]
MFDNILSAWLLDLPPVVVILLLVVIPVVIAIITYVIVSKDVDKVD